MINPFYDFSLGLPFPKVQRASWSKRAGKVSVPIENQGNGRTSLLVSAQDEENGCQFEFPAITPSINGGLLTIRQTEITLEPGEALEVPMRVSPLRRSLVRLRNREYRYQVNAVTLGVEPAGAVQTVPGTLVSRPLFGLLSILLLIALLLYGGFQIFRPRIESFSVAEKVIRQGDKALLRWKVSPFTSDLRIEGIAQPISGSSGSLEVEPKQEVESYTLYAGNFLSQFLRLKEIHSQQETVVVIPPSPQIATFSVDKSDILNGDDVNVKWSVTDANAVYLTIEGVRNALAADEFSGERTVKIRKDSLVILEAQNSSGAVTRSSFVKVRDISIIINEFSISRSEIYAGEPISITWDVGGEGVSTVSISPFSEELPLRNKLNYFPKESMEFVLTVKNRDLTEVRLLSVGVLPPDAPPTPPTINYFKASPDTITGPGNVEFSWGVSGITDKIQITNINGVVADNLAAQGFKAIAVSQTTSYVLTAYNGSVSTSAIVEVTVNPALRNVLVVITSVIPTTVQRGDSVVAYVDVRPIVDGVAITDTARAGLPEVSGNVVVTDGFDTCDFDLPKKSCLLTLNRSGDKTLTATYGGDDHYVRRTSAPYPLIVTVFGLQAHFINMAWNPSSTVYVGQPVSLTFMV